MQQRHVNLTVPVDAAYMYPFWQWVGGPWLLVKYRYKQEHPGEK